MAWAKFSAREYAEKLKSVLDEKVKEIVNEEAKLAASRVHERVAELSMKITLDMQSNYSIADDTVNVHAVVRLRE